MKRIGVGLISAGLLSTLPACGSESSGSKPDVVEACGESRYLPGALSGDEIVEAQSLLHIAVEYVGKDKGAMSTYAAQALPGGDRMTELGVYVAPEGFPATRLGQLLCADPDGFVHYIDTPPLYDFVVAATQQYHLNHFCELNAEDASSKDVVVNPDCK